MLYEYLFVCRDIKSFSKEFREKLLTALLDDLHQNNIPVSDETCTTLLKIFGVIQPNCSPVCSSIDNGNIIVSWTNGVDMLTIECLSKDRARCALSYIIDGGHKFNECAVKLHELQIWLIMLLADQISVS